MVRHARMAWCWVLSPAGKLIGQNGIYIKKLKEECRCNIILKVSVITWKTSSPSFSISFHARHHKTSFNDHPYKGDGGYKTKEGWKNEEGEEWEAAAAELFPGSGGAQGLQHRGDQGQHRQVLGHCQTEVSWPLFYHCDCATLNLDIVWEKLVIQVHWAPRRGELWAGERFQGIKLVDAHRLCLAFPRRGLHAWSLCVQHCWRRWVKTHIWNHTN